MDGHVLTFESSADGTGMLDVIASGAALESQGGVVSAVSERYIAPDSDGVTFSGYTLYSSPLTGVKVGDLDNIPGFYLAGLPGTDWPNSFSTVLFWDETKAEFIEPRHERHHDANIPICARPNHRTCYRFPTCYRDSQRHALRCGA